MVWGQRVKRNQAAYVVCYWGKMAELTGKQQKFVNEYLIDGNATRAAERAGYSGDLSALAATGYENLRKPHIASVIQQRLQESAMAADEVLMRLAAHARADMDDFLDDNGFISVVKARHGKRTALIRRFKTRTFTRTIDDRVDTTVETEIELHDAQAALVHLGKYHGLWLDRQQVKIEGEIPIAVVKMPVDEL